MKDETIRGYRPLGDRPKDRQLSYDYMLQTTKAAKLLTVLRTEAAKQNAPCTKDPEKWAGDELPTDREAQLMCSTCPVIDLCRQYADEAHPAWSVWGGRVYGRNLQAAMKEGETNDGRR